MLRGENTMKLSNIASTVAALAVATTAALTIGTHIAKADGVAVVHTQGVCTLYQNDGARVTYRGLAPDTGWQVGKIINLDGFDYYQVSTNEYIKETDAYYSNPNASNNQAEYVPNLEKINYYFGQYLNALHKANGTQPVTYDSSLLSYAVQRADQQVGGPLDHSTASRDMSECLHSGGYFSASSDKEVAYVLLKGWYNEDNNVYGPGQKGHYGHRAALIYAGPRFALGLNDEGIAAFEPEWDYSTLDQQMDLYDYTGSNPNTKFISEDAI